MFPKLFLNHLVFNGIASCHPEIYGLYPRNSLKHGYCILVYGIWVLFSSGGNTLPFLSINMHVTSRVSKS